MFPEMRLIWFAELRNKASLQKRRSLVLRKATKRGDERRVEPVGNRFDVPVIDFCGNCGLVPSRYTPEFGDSVEEFSLDPALCLDLPRCPGQSPFRSISRQAQIQSRNINSFTTVRRSSAANAVGRRAYFGGASTPAALCQHGCTELFPYFQYAEERLSEG